MKFNTAIAAFMTVLNEIYDKGSITKGELKTLLILLNPFAPHVTEEEWSVLNLGGTVTEQSWPDYDEAKCVADSVEIVVQICGKIRARMNIDISLSAEEVIALAKEDETIKAEIAGKNIVKELYVPGKLVNIVAK